MMPNSKSFEEILSADAKEAVHIEWRNVNFSVVEKDGKKSTLGNPIYRTKHILRDMAGHAKSGELLALMGPTGCGKTSLLNVLAARVSAGGSSNAKISGDILINGSPRHDEGFRRMSAYVVQDDRMYAHLTVFETLMLAAHFYMPTNSPDETKLSTVESVIAELGLRKARDTIIGDERVKGVSGGERKRANVAVQMISSPAVLLLDEPTSGLDSFQAQSIMDCMKNLAMNGRLVIAVIHQPRSSIYNMFDKLLLLSEGRTMFYGNASDAAKHFERQGFPCPTFFNPCDFFLDVLSPDIRSLEAERKSQGNIKLLGDTWAEIARERKMSLSESGAMSMEPPTCVESIDMKRLVRNFQLLCWRAAAEQGREIPTLVIKLCVTFFFALLIGGIFSNIGYNQKSIQSRTGLLFLMAINQGFNSLIGVLNTFPREKVIVNRERSARAYDALSYFCAKYVVEIPLNILPSCIFGCIIYWIVGLNPNRFGYFLLIIMFEALTGISLGLAVSAATPSVEAANACGPPLLILSLLFGGFFINVDSLPIVANWLPYVSFLKWTFESLAINEFTGATFDCTNGPANACEKTGEVVLSRLSFGGDTIEYACFGLGMLLLGFTFVALQILIRSKEEYMPLGHEGSSFKKRSADEEAVAAGVSAGAVVVVANEIVGKEKSLKEYYQGTRTDEKLVLEWDRVCYSTFTKDPVAKKMVCKDILHNCSGRGESGELLAIMGPTGCGKTSLMNILAARVPNGGAEKQQLTGSIKINGVDRNESSFRRISAYVLQDDYMYAHLTVFETLLLSAHFFLPTHKPLAEKLELIEIIIAELGLRKARDTIIGDDKLRGVSGGERKRTNIGVQMITDPAVFFLDEPTSGLDAFQALSVMECMKDLANNGRLVISVIHQPRSSIYNMFDKLLLLSEGRTMFYGKASDAVDHFSALGFSCPSDFSPADYFLDVLSPDNRTPLLEKAASQRILLVGDEWEKSHAGAASDMEKGAVLKTEVTAAGSAISEIGNKRDLTKLVRNMGLLCWRAWAEQSRDVVTLGIKIMITLIFSLVVGGIYSNIGLSQKSIQNRNGLLFFVAIQQSFLGILGVLNVFPKEKNIVQRERAGRAYDTTSYFFAKYFVEMPLNLVPSVIYSTIVYWLVGLNSDRFGEFVGIGMLTTCVAVSLGLAVSAAVPTVEAANGLGPPCLIVGILFGGFYIDVASLPIVANWIPYFSFIRWAFQAYAINEYRGMRFDCGDAPAGACKATGEQVLVLLSFDKHTTNYPLFGMGMVLLGFLSTAYFIIYFNKAKYTRLGHKGKQYDKLSSASQARVIKAEGEDVNYAAVPSNLDPNTVAVAE